MQQQGDCRDWHWLTRLTKTNVPSSLMFVQTSTYDVADAEKKDRKRQYLALWIAKAIRLERGNISRIKLEDDKDANSFWEFVRSRLDAKRPLWIFCDNLGRVMTLLELWRKVIDHEFVFCQVDSDAKEENGEPPRPSWLGMAVLADPPSFVRMRLKGDSRTIVIVDTQNYFRQSVAEIAASLGTPERAEVPYEMQGLPGVDQAYQDVVTLEESVTGLIELIRTEKLGRFCYTIPSQAMAAFRARFLQDDKTILVHGKESALTIERESYHGGCCHVWYVGKVRDFTKPQREVSHKLNGFPVIPAPIYHLDVTSFYPWIMANRNYPVRLIRYEGKPDYSLLDDNDENIGRIARVKLRCESPGFPVSRNGKTFYAVGRICTSLAGPELARAVREKCIMAIDAVASYEMFPVFKHFAEWLIEKRQSYKRQDNPAFALALKLLGNSFYGKWGQWRWLWDNDETRQAPIPLGTWPESRELTEEEIREALKRGEYATIKEARSAIKTFTYRSICWLSQVKGAKQEHKESCPAIASFVTAYGREYVLHLSSIAGTENCLYSDTDSLHVTTDGFNRLEEAGFIKEGVAGLLSVKSIGHSAWYRGPKDYTLGREVVIAGRKADAENLPRGHWIQSKNERLSSILSGGQLDGIAVDKVKVKMPSHAGYYRETSSGRTEPILLNEW